jgi:hypothetical protein
MLGAKTGRHSKPEGCNVASIGWIEDLFKVGDKTILAGLLESDEVTISSRPCIVEIDGREVGALRIEGEVETGTGNRDMWTRSELGFDRETIRRHSVWLIAK